MKKVLMCLIIIVSLGFIGCGKTNTATNIPNKATKNIALAATQQTQNTEIQYYFPRAGQHPDKELINIINNTKSNLDIAIYSITDKDIVNAIISAKNRGITVRIISDKVESKNKYQKQELQLLKNAGIPIKINNHRGIMHLKVTIADNSIVTTGSYNYTEAATKYNDEVLVVINNGKVAQDFDAEFEVMWNDNSNFKNF